MAFQYTTIHAICILSIHILPESVKQVGTKHDSLSCRVGYFRCAGNISSAARHSCISQSPVQKACNWRRFLQSHEPVCSGLFGSIIAQSHSKRNKIFILLRSLVTKKKSLLRPANTRPLPRGSPPVRQQNTCFAAFGLRFLILMHKNTKIALS